MISDRAGKTYHRYAKPDNPMSDWGHAMFSEEDRSEGSKVGDLQNYEFHATAKNQVPIEFLHREIIREFIKDQEQGFSDFLDSETLALSPKQFAKLFNPSNIHNSAEAWDSSEFTQWIWNKVLEPQGIGAVTTEDGAIVFDPKLIKKRGK